MSKALGLCALFEFLLLSAMRYTVRNGSNSKKLLGPLVMGAHPGLAGLLAYPCGCTLWTCPVVACSAALYLSRQPV